jgi:hypothetical protein
VRELDRDGDGGSSWKSWGVVCKIYVSDANVVILICEGLGLWKTLEIEITLDCNNTYLSSNLLEC